jgi:hypothetical protein
MRITGTSDEMVENKDSRDSIIGEYRSRETPAVVRSFSTSVLLHESEPPN